MVISVQISRAVWIVNDIYFRLSIIFGSLSSDRGCRCTKRRFKQPKQKHLFRLLLLLPVLLFILEHSCLSSNCGRDTHSHSLQSLGSADPFSQISRPTSKTELHETTVSRVRVMHVDVKLFDGICCLFPHEVYL
jgi:hypothetical protein